MSLSLVVAATGTRVARTGHVHAGTFTGKSRKQNAEAPDTSALTAVRSPSFLRVERFAVSHMYGTDTKRTC